MTDRSARNFMRMTEERKQKYLQGVRETASYTQAARIATPNALGPEGARSTFEKPRRWRSDRSSWRKAPPSVPTTQRPWRKPAVCFLNCNPAGMSTMQPKGRML